MRGVSGVMPLCGGPSKGVYGGGFSGSTGSCGQHVIPQYWSWGLKIPFLQLKPCIVKDLSRVGKNILGRGNSMCAGLENETTQGSEARPLCCGAWGRSQVFKEARWSVQLRIGPHWPTM